MTVNRIFSLFVAALIAPSVLTGVLSAPLAEADDFGADDFGVLCRFKGQNLPGGNPAEIWNKRWDLGPGVDQVNDDCEAVLALEEGTPAKWVGSRMPPRLHYVKARAEVGVSDDFVSLPGERIVFMEIGGARISDTENQPPFLAQVSLGRTPDGHPDDYDLHISWVSDDDQGSFVEGPFRRRPGRRLLVRIHWEASNDADRDYQPDPDGEISFWVNGVKRYIETGLVIDQTTPTELRFGHNGIVPPGTFGDLFVRPLGIDTAYFDREE